MKIWNNPELEELEIKLTANGETESDAESSATDIAVMCFGGGYKPKPNRPGNGGWPGGGNGGWPGCGDDDDDDEGGDGDGNNDDFPIPGES